MAYTDIDKPSDYFNTVLYTGTGSARTISGVGFQPDWVWVKDRTTTNYHYLYDSVRGNNLNFFSNDTSAEVNVTTGQNGGGIGSQASDGFNIVAGNVNTNNVNTNTNLYASWNWLASNTTASNTDGSITSTVSANTTSGFSIVSYTGTGSAATIGHGLSSVPSMIIVKGRSYVDNWCVFHSSLGGGKKLKLNTTGAEITNSTPWNNTSPTSSVFSVGTDGETNNSGSTMIAYCFAEKQGYSKFGSYIGNGSTDGTFVYTGFKPAFVIYKGASGTGTTDNWEMIDNKRTDGTIGNPKNEVLYPNLSNAEGVNQTDRLDLLSNGFKMRTSGSDYNASGSTYIYMAFAENPFVTSTSIPCTAR